MTSSEDAFQRGWDDFYHRSECPYNETELREAWALGYDEAESEFLFEDDEDYEEGEILW